MRYRPSLENCPTTRSIPADLVQQIEDFPPEDQWDALKKEVRGLQVLPQTTEYAFYITWALPVE